MVLLKPTIPTGCNEGSQLLPRSTSNVHIVMTTLSLYDHSELHGLLQKVRLLVNHRKVIKGRRAGSVLLRRYISKDVILGTAGKLRSLQHRSF